MFTGKTVLAAALAVGITMLLPLSSEAKHHHHGFNGNNAFAVNLGNSCPGRGLGRFGKSMNRNFRNNNYFNPYGNSAFYNGCNNDGWGNARWNRHSAWQNWNNGNGGWRNNGNWNNNGNHYGWRNSAWKNGNNMYCGNGNGHRGRNWW